MENNKISKKISRIKKGNLWYPPTKSLYTFLTRLESLGLPKTLAVLGCADGNYVIPAARRGFEVLAIDIDRIALYGGKTNFGGKDLEILGLKKKLKRFGLEKNVKIVNESYFEYEKSQTYSGVITSESTHYQINSKHTLEKRLEIIESYVSVGGLLLFEYLHLSNRNSDPKRFLTSGQLDLFFKSPKWKIISNKNKTYVEEPNPRINEVHEIILGRLYAKRNI